MNIYDRPARGQNEYAGAWSFDPNASCDDTSTNATTFIIAATVGETTMTTSVTAIPSFQSLAGLQAEAAGHGVSLTPDEASAFYAQNGLPMKASDSPLRFDAASRTVTVGSGERTIVMERSRNLRDWETLGTVKVPVGTRLRIEDTTTDGQQFYRLTTP